MVALGAGRFLTGEIPLECITQMKAREYTKQSGRGLCWEAETSIDMQICLHEESLYRGTSLTRKKTRALQ